MRLLSSILATVGLALLVSIPVSENMTGRKFADSQRTLISQLEDDVISLKPEEGDPVGVVRIPELDLRFALVYGVDQASLEAGVGWVPGSSGLGGAGNIAFAGHRSGWGAPFADLDQLHAGSLVEVEWFTGASAVFVVSEAEVVEPTDVAHMSSLMKGDHNTLSLITCHPRGSFRQRLVVTAVEQSFASTDLHEVFLGSVNSAEGSLLEIPVLTRGR